MGWFAGGAGVFAIGRIRRLLTRVLGLLLLGIVVYFGVSVGQVLAASRVSQRPADVAKTTYIVVMGEHPLHSSLSKDTKDRLDQAMSLFQAGRGKKIVIAILATCTRCPAFRAGSERQFLEKQGLPARDLVELAATSDDGLLAGVPNLIGKKGSSAVVIVSDPLDSLRLRATAASHGLAPEISPASPPGSGILGDAGTIGQQALAVSLGRVFGFSSTGWASS